MTDRGAASTIRFFLVDVFADRPLTGNPLAVVPDADSLLPSQMRAVAREFNQSETTFLLKPESTEADWRLRSFTPAGSEVGGAGHNALGAWLWLDSEGLAGDTETSHHVQEIGSNLLPLVVHRSPGERPRVVMDQGPASFGPELADVDALARSLEIGVDQLDLRLAPRAGSTGVSHLLVALRGRGDVDAVKPSPRELAALLSAAGAEGCYVFSTAPGQEPDDYAAYARFFNPTVGIVEDPATGTAAGPLAALLVRSGRAEATAPVHLEQGRALGRPSRIRVDVQEDQVRISGSGLVVGHGELSLR